MQFNAQTPRTLNGSYASAEQIDPTLARLAHALTFGGIASLNTGIGASEPITDGVRSSAPRVTCAPRARYAETISYRGKRYRLILHAID